MKLARLGDIAEFINGVAFKPQDWGSSGKKIIRIQNLTDQSKPYNFTDRIVDDKYIVRRGDVLVSWSATIDIFTWDDDDALVNQHIFKVVFDTSKVVKPYFIFALKKTIDELSKFAHGSTMKHVVKKDFDNHKIPLPSLEDQIHIANILSKAEALIAQRKESLRLLDEFLKSTFLEMFGSSNKDFKKWSVFNISNLAEQKKGSMRTGPFGSDLLHSEFIDNGPVRVLGIDNVVNNRFEWSSIRCISLKKFEGLKRYQVFPNDVLISIMATNGRTAVVPENIPKCINSKHLAAITVDRNRVDPIFLSFSFHSDPQILKQLSNQTRGAIMGGLNLTIIKGLKLKLPPLKLQTQFARIVKKTDELKAHYQTSLQELENLYGSLSQRAFSPAGNLLKEGKGELMGSGEIKEASVDV